MLNFNELNYFLAVAKSQSFVRAGKKLHLSASALSHSMRNLEARLGLRLFNRTTRSVSLTASGQQLYKQLLPLYEEIQNQVNSLNEYLSVPSGKIRINAPAAVILSVLYPKLLPLLEEHQLLQLEITSEDRAVDIIKDGYDMGVREGQDFAQGMVHVQISGPVKMVLVASAEYIERKGMPTTIADLSNHHLIATQISNEFHQIQPWEFIVDGTRVQYTPEAKLTVNGKLRKAAVSAHAGICWLPRDVVEEEIKSGKFVEVLSEHSVSLDPLYLYYPSRKGMSQAFKLVVETLKYRPLPPLSKRATKARSEKDK